MVRFENFELVDMLLIYGEARQNCRAAEVLYQERYPNRRAPDRRYFETVRQRLVETGSLTTIRQGNPVRPVRNPDFDEDVLAHFAVDPTTSTRRVARTLGVSHASVWRVLHEERMHPYHLQKVQHLKNTDFQPRLDFCRWLINRRNLRRSFSDHILYTDEASFGRDGIFNSRNSHIWNAENPHGVFIRSHQERFSINVWAGIIGSHLVGPYLLPNRLTSDGYTNFLNTVLVDLLEDIPILIRQRMWFQHDGAPAHSSRVVRATLNRRFPNKWIGRGGPTRWPARSPDLNPLDFFFWGKMKSLVYETEVETEEDLIARVVAAAGEISDKPEVLEQVVNEEMLRRCRGCVQSNGGHFEQFLR